MPTIKYVIALYDLDGETRLSMDSSGGWDGYFSTQKEALAHLETITRNPKYIYRVEPVSVN